MFNKMRERKYINEIKKLAVEYKNAQGLMGKPLIAMKANAIKSKCANLVMMDKFDVNVYAELFKVEKANAYHHFLEIWNEEEED